MVEEETTKLTCCIPYLPFSEALLWQKFLRFMSKRAPGVISHCWGWGGGKYYCLILSLHLFTHLRHWLFLPYLLQSKPCLVNCYVDSGMVVLDLIAVSIVCFLSSCSFTILIAFQLGFSILLPLTTSSSVKSLNFKIFQVIYLLLLKQEMFFSSA